MRAFVLQDASLASHARQFVWLEINTEETANAPVLDQFPVEAMPSYFVVDPVKESVAIRWVGGLTVPQLHTLLDEGRAAVAGAADSSAADAALARADRFYGEARNAEAAEAYRAALAVAPAGWQRYGRVAESLAFAFQRTEAYVACVELARASLPRVAGTPSLVNLAVAGLDCALDLPEDRPDRASAIAELEAALRKALHDPGPRPAADDCSTGYSSLLEARKQAKDTAGARAAAEEWSAFLEAEVAKARTAEERAVFDSHRLTVYQELGQLDRAIAMLQAAERDLPGDYNPPARLAVAYQSLQQWDQALAAAERALARAYGPRKLRVHQVRAEVLAAKGDVPGARRALEEAIAFGETLPERQRPQRMLAALKKKLEELKAAGSAPGGR
jgi:tetratricopeptide (TPR) repeat protein